MEVRGAEAASCMGVVEACGCRKELLLGRACGEIWNVSVTEGRG